MQATSGAGFRVWAVAIVLLLLVGGTLAGAVFLTVQKLGAGQEAAPAPWQADERIIDLLGGRSITLKAAPGFVEVQQVGVTVLHHDATQTGFVDVDLCHQRTANPVEHDRLYPVLVSEDASILQTGLPKSLSIHGKTRLRAPVLVGAEPAPVQDRQAPRMPTFVVAGQAHDLAQQPQALLQLDFATETPQHGWAVLGDVRGFEHGPVRTVFNKSIWVLWGANADGDYTYAMRLDRTASPSAVACKRMDRAQADDPGVLRLRLYRGGSEGKKNQLRKVIVFGARSGDGLLYLNLPSGEHSFPVKPEKLEDHRLFSQAMALGLIQGQPNGRLQVAPADLERAQLAGLPTPGWPDVLNDPQRQRLLQRLHYKADGRYVRNRISHYNQTRMWAAVRLRSDDDQARQALNRAFTAGWQASLTGTPVPLEEGLPDIAVRLFKQMPQDWGRWMRASRWPALALQDSHSELELRLNLAEYPQLRGKHIELLALNGVTVREGGALLRQGPACHGPSCVSEHMLTHLELKVASDADQLVLGLQIGDDLNQLAVEASHAEEIRTNDGQTSWHARPSRPYMLETTQQPWPSIIAADGQVLHLDGAPTALANDMGLSRLLGLGPDHLESIATVARESGHSVVPVTLDPRYQTLARAVLSCIALGQGQWLASEQRCELPPAESNPLTSSDPPVASLVLLDAAQGDILAAVELPDPPQFSSVAEQLAFHRYHLSASPLAMWSWQHDGSSRHAPGSTAKLISALAFESLAISNRSIDAQLNGVGPKDGFSFTSPCYPSCSARARIENYQRHPPARYANNGRFGLHQALVHSVNTWFAHTTELHETLLKHPLVDPYGLPVSLSGGLKAQRPFDAVLHDFGFGQSWRLDDGLFDTHLPANSVLRTTPSAFDWVRDRHNLRQQAIGLRASVTPLQMAYLAAGIATGARPPQPRLIRAAEAVTGTPLPMRLDRIRKAMQAVPSEGTGRTAFNKNATRRALLGAVYAKTGTAPLLDAEQRNSAWFVGYVDAHTLPGEAAPLAFAVRVSPTRATGGALAAEAIAAFFETLMLDSAPSTTRVTP